MSNTQQEDARGPDQRGGGGHLRLLTLREPCPGLATWRTGIWPAHFI